MSLTLVAPRPGRSRFFRLRGTIRGVRVDETTGTSSRDAAEAIRIKRENEILQRSIFGAGVDRTFAEAAVAYVETVAPRGTQRDAVLGRKRKDGSLTPNLVDEFGAKLLAEIDQIAVNRLVAKRFADASPSTVQRNLLTPLVTVLRFAAGLGWCTVPVLKRPRAPRGRKRWATYDEATALVDAAAAHIRPLLVFLAYTGARMAEAIELDWREVDLSGAWVVFRDTKNGEDRGVPLHPVIVAELAELPHRNGPVFLTNRGAGYADRERRTGGQIKTAWFATCARAGLARWSGKGRRRKLEWVADQMTPHDLRHTFSTWLTMAGVHEQVRDELMGHASTDMGRRYSHVPRPLLVEAVNRLPTLLFRAKSVEDRVRQAAKRKRLQAVG